MSRAAAPGRRDGWWVALGLLGLTLSMLWPGLITGGEAFIGETVFTTRHETVRHAGAVGAGAEARPSLS